MFLKWNPLIFLYLLSSVSSGLPDGFFNTICPAAMLQHVLRPHQQRWETNPAVYRLVAVLLVTSIRHLPSTTPWNVPLWLHSHNELKTKKRDEVGRDSCTYPWPPCFLIMDDEHCRCEVIWRGKGLLTSLKSGWRSPFWNNFNLDERLEALH